MANAADFGAGTIASSLRFGDLNGDGRDDVCALVSGALACAFSTGKSFTRSTTWITKTAIAEQGWSREELASTIQLADVNGDGRADLCGRGRDGIVCGLAP